MSTGFKDATSREETNHWASGNCSLKPVVADELKEAVHRALEH